MIDNTLHQEPLSHIAINAKLRRKFTQLDPVKVISADDNETPVLSQVLYAKVSKGNIIVQTCTVTADSSEPTGLKKSYLFEQYTDNADGTVLAETDGINKNLVASFLNTVNAVVNDSKMNDSTEKSHKPYYDDTLEESLVNIQGLHKAPDETVKILLKQKKLVR